ncbi:MAG: MFS transporter [Pseudomonadota bacterium]|nr:MFS transporter [Pseudomonadota bacterium]
MSTPSTPPPHPHAPWIVILAGVSAALHVAKLPPALPVLQQELGITLVQAGFLLSLVQVAAMALGIVAGLLAEGMGLKRAMVAGLCLLTVAGAAGGWAQGVASLLALRAVEGVGFLLATVPAPSLLRRMVAPTHMTRMLGVWSAFMPLGTGVALLLGPLVMAAWPWPVWWWLTAALSLVMAAWVRAAVPDDPPPTPRHQASGERWQQRLAGTLGARGPWLGALTFGVYSAQWLAVIGFLPSLYQASGWGGVRGAVLTALVAAANITGNIAAGRLLHRGVAPQRLLWTGFGAMALGAFLAFGTPTAHAPVARYVGALLFSSVGGLIPGTLFGLAPRLAPGERTIATTVGWMQQLSAVGQVSGPPLVAWVAGVTGGWQTTWVVTASCCVAGALLAVLIGRQLRSYE